MRLWHKDLIPVLPRQQLLGQWRECCLIAKNIHQKGTPNHILVNKVMDYSIGHFWEYGFLVMREMHRRGYKCDFDKFEQWFEEPWKILIPREDLYEGWHNERYLTQCFYNLEEKYDCGGITDDEWTLINDRCIDLGMEYKRRLIRGEKI